MEWDMGSQCNGGYARVGSKLSTLWVGRVSDGRVVNRQSTHTTSQYKKYDERPGTVGAGARAAGLTVCSGVSLEIISAYVSA